jgi:hypothetical protein
MHGATIELSPRRLFDYKFRSQFRWCCGLTVPNFCDEGDLDSLSSAACDGFLVGVLTYREIKYFTNKRNLPVDFICTVIRTDTNQAAVRFEHPLPS